MNKKETFHFLNFDMIVGDAGVLLLSKLNLDWPFVIINNDKFGLVVLHSNEVNYLRMYVNGDVLDLKSMLTYAAEMEDGEKWVLAIPYSGAVLQASDYLAGIKLNVYKEFKDADFPKDFEKYGSLSVVTGFRE